MPILAGKYIFHTEGYIRLSFANDCKDRRLPFSDLSRQNDKRIVTDKNNIYGNRDQT